MVTVRKVLEQKCLVNGMFDSQAMDAIGYAIREYEKSDAYGEIGYSMCWDSDANDYPEMLYGVIFIALKSYILTWIEENKPEAWFKELFR